VTVSETTLRLRSRMRVRDRQALKAIAL
jgi:hypothetical protein